MPLVSVRVSTSIRALPEIQSETPLRFGPAQIAGQGDFLVAADPQATVDMFDFDVKSGDFGALDVNGIAVSQDKADANDWTVGDTVPVRDYVVDVPWLLIALVLVVLPLVSAVVAAAATRSRLDGPTRLVA